MVGQLRLIALVLPSEELDSLQQLLDLLVLQFHIVLAIVLEDSVVSGFLLDDLVKPSILLTQIEFLFLGLCRQLHLFVNDLVDLRLSLLDDLHEFSFLRCFVLQNLVDLTLKLLFHLVKLTLHFLLFFLIQIDQTIHVVIKCLVLIRHVLKLPLKNVNLLVSCSHVLIEPSNILSQLRLDLVLLLLADLVILNLRICILKVLLEITIVLLLDFHLILRVLETTS